MITVTYTAPIYAPEKVTRRYVRRCCVSCGYRWCEIGANLVYDLRQGSCEAEDLPEDVRAQADALQGAFPSYVKWPIA